LLLSRQFTASAYRFMHPVFVYFPAIKSIVRSGASMFGLAKHTLATVTPKVIRPNTEQATIAITAQCNLRCIGCRYGRDFMAGHQLSYRAVAGVLDDCRAVGIRTVRLYGGEPLLHPDLPGMIAHGTKLGLHIYVTTNGTLLRRRIDDLYESGLRRVTIGFYGVGDEYDRYVQRDHSYLRLEEGLEYVRRRYGQSMSLQMNFLVHRNSCSSASLRSAWEIAERFDMTFQVDLVHYSLPYFTEGPERLLQIRNSDEQAVRDFTASLLALKSKCSRRIPESDTSIRSIPDWLLQGPAMRVPCDVYNLIWIGADGSVQLCYVTFPLGNVNTGRLRDMLYTEAHVAAARDSYTLQCPNCHCQRSSRINKHLPSRLRYSRWLGERFKSGTREQIVTR
jgi:MoaA/NifB/PqqE/SkfB family radical SAM enzyme